MGNQYSVKYVYGEDVKCRKCGETKEYTEENFYRDKSYSQGLATVCKKCSWDMKKEYRQTEKYRASQKEYRITHNEQSKNYKKTVKGVYAAYKGNAKFHNRYFDLTIEDFEELWQTQCQYCGVKLDTLGLDRIDSSRRYSKDNVYPCCTQCNVMKLDYSMEAFIRQCGLIYARCKQMISK